MPPVPTPRPCPNSPTDHTITGEPQPVDDAAVDDALLDLRRRQMVRRACLHRRVNQPPVMCDHRPPHDLR